MSARVTVIDYGVGNVHSVVKAFRHEGAEVSLTGDPAEVLTANRLVLPGVGAFGDGMRELLRRDLVAPIREYVKSGRPLIGICLGMQLLLSESEEFGRSEGLGVIPGKVALVKPSGGLKVPHIGWNRIAPPDAGSWAGSVLDGVPGGSMVYFVHSYTAVPDDSSHRLADTMYGDFTIAAAVRSGNVTGCQFHPEKSGPIGLRIVRRFLTEKNDG